MLFEVGTERWLFRLKGPDRASILTGEGATPPTLRVVVAGGEDSLVRVRIGTVTSAARGRSIVGTGPALFEQTPYRVTVESTTGAPAKLEHLDPTLTADIEPLPGNAAVLTGSINFGSQVGDTTFVLTDGSGHSMSVSVEVRPSKLDYQQDFAELLDGVNDVARQLTFEFLQATTVGGAVAEADRGTTADWLVLLRDEVDNLDRALRYITANPHAELIRDAEFQAIHRIRRPTTLTRNALARGQGEGSWISSHVAAQHRARLPAIRPTETTNTPEHRWLRAELASITSRLAALEVQHRAPRRLAGVENEPSARRRAIATELGAFRTRLATYLSLEPFATAVGSAKATPSSLVFQQRPGYREAGQALWRIKSATTLHGDALNLPLRTLSDLYEIWCFVAVVRLVADLTGHPVEMENVIEVSDQGSRFTVRKGQRSRVTFALHDGRIDVLYNPTYKTATGPQKPDIVIEVNRRGEPSVLLVIDAKYRVRADEKYLLEFKAPGPPVDAIEQLHRYRDAITVQDQSKTAWRSVTRAVAAFPLNRDHIESWKGHRFRTSIDAVGVGGIPFLPSNTDGMRLWIQQALNMSRVDLAWPGPLFLAWESARGQVAQENSANLSQSDSLASMSQ